MPDHYCHKLAHTIMVCPKGNPKTDLSAGPQRGLAYSIGHASGRLCRGRSGGQRHPPPMGRGCTTTQRAVCSVVLRGGGLHSALAASTQCRRILSLPGSTTDGGRAHRQWKQAPQQRPVPPVGNEHRPPIGPVVGQRHHRPWGDAAPPGGPPFHFPVWGWPLKRPPSTSLP